MSDRQKGLDKAVSIVFPNATQRYCFNHITKNMHNNKHWRGHDKYISLASIVFKKSDHLRALERLKQD